MFSLQIYKELAAQKKEKEDREKANQPRERNYAEEQAKAVELLREKEAEMSARCELPPPSSIPTCILHNTFHCIVFIVVK